MSDAELVARAQAGDSEAFARLVKKYQGLVVSLARNYVGSNMAEDLAQELWLTVYRKLWQVEDVNKFAAWLKQVIYYQYLNFRKRRSRLLGREIYLSSEGWETVTQYVTHDEPSLEAMVIRRDTRALISRLLDRLPGDYGLLLRLYYLRDMNYKEIQEITGLEASTLKWRLYQGRKLLKTQLVKLYTNNKQGVWLSNGKTR